MNYNSKLMVYEMETSQETKIQDLKNFMSELGPKCAQWTTDSIKGNLTTQKKDPIAIAKNNGEIFDNEAEAREYCSAMGINLESSSVGSIILDGTNRIGNYLSFCETRINHPKIASSKKGVLNSFRLRHNKFIMKDDSYTELERLEDGSYGIYKINLPPQFSEARKTETKTTSSGKEIVKTLCKANYNRNPRDGKSYGTPATVPPWITDGQGCLNCSFSPHKREKDMARKDACVNYPQNILVINCKVDGVEKWVGPVIFETPGQWGLNLLKGCFGLSDAYGRILKFGVIQLEKKASKQSRTIEDLTLNEKSFAEKNDELYKACLQVTGAFRRLLIMRNTKRQQEIQPQLNITTPFDDATEGFTGEIG